MKKREPVDISWLPPREEWDYRPVPVEEGRIGCYWEASRVYVIPNNAARVEKWEQFHLIEEGAYWCPLLDKWTSLGVPFGQPWLALTKEQRAVVLATLKPVPTLHIRSLKDEIAERLKMVELGDQEALLRGSQRGYVLRPDFSGKGVEAIIIEATKWLREEAKRLEALSFDQRSADPFFKLKLLALLQLERARSQTDITWEVANETLKEYRDNTRGQQGNRNDVLPIYDNVASWSTAKKKADQFLVDFGLDPLKLLDKEYAVFDEA